MRYDTLIFIGRFQPFHRGHETVIRQALPLSDKIIVLIGSAHQPRTVRNPWDFNEREALMRCVFSKEENSQILAFPLLDYIYNEQLWIKSIQQIVSGVSYQKIASSTKIGIIGHQKDQSSSYLSNFPQWERLEVANFENISSTDIREAYFNDKDFTHNLNSSVAILLEKFAQTQEYKKVKDEFHFIKKYKSSWDDAPYPPIFVTVDAVVIQSGHILLIERKAQPSKGLMALAGGFVDQNEPLKTAMLRELKEETKIKVPLPVLEGSISKQAVFDDPHRSQRGRTITHAYLIELKGDKLPKVKGGDDGKRAFWIPFADIKPEMMFEDHFHIIQVMVG
jgi:bifunctional NMN adenylyltransferase/nudix hydrolase